MVGDIPLNHGNLVSAISSSIHGDIPGLVPCKVASKVNWETIISVRAFS